jgi:hypothetical protein
MRSMPTACSWRLTATAMASSGNSPI